MTVLTRMIGFAATSDPVRAKRFYGETLGFRLRSDDDFALVFDANGTMLRIVKSQPFTPQRGTILGWEVTDIYSAVRQLSERGVEFEQFHLPFLLQDELGIWTPANGDHVAWFKDPDGNVLSVSQHNPEH